MADRLEVSAVWRGGWATDVTARAHEVRVDEPASAGGGDGGMMPTELFCAALASCFCKATFFCAIPRSAKTYAGTCCGEFY